MALAAGPDAAVGVAPGGTLSDRLDVAFALVASVAAEFDAGLLTGRDARSVLERSVVAARHLEAIKAMAAKRVADAGAHAAEGFSSPAGLLAAIEGTGIGGARNTLRRAEVAAAQPGLEDALRKGTLSSAQADAIAEAAEVAPGPPPD